MQKYYLLIALLTITPALNGAEGEIAEKACYEFIRAAEENYKHAHKNQDCLSAANAGLPGALYQVGMGFGFDNEHDKEIMYYRKAANARSIAAYLALGHMLSEDNETYYEAIYWYQRYVSAKPKPEATGYAAIRISQIFKAMGDAPQAEYWKEVCESYSKTCE